MVNMFVWSKMARAALKSDLGQLYDEKTTYSDLKNAFIFTKNSIFELNKGLSNISFKKGTSQTDYQSLNRAYGLNEALVYLLDRVVSHSDYVKDSVENKMSIRGALDPRDYVHARDRIMDTVRTGPPALSKENTVYRFLNFLKKEVDCQDVKAFDINKYREKNLKEYLTTWGIATNQILNVEQKKSNPEKKTAV